MNRPLPRKFFSRPTVQVARELLGKVLVHATGDGTTSGMVVEDEAYLGEYDPGSHAARGITPRNSVMFGTPGLSYVYFTYGMHYCFNAVAKPEGKAGAVLIRALEPLKGEELMQKRRGRDDRLSLTSGPAKLAQALAIGREQNSVDLTSGDLYFTDGTRNDFSIGNSCRIGLSKGRELPLRFYIEGNPYVSRKTGNSINRRQNNKTKDD